jgi:hypothetical protein
MEVPFLACFTVLSLQEKISREVINVFAFTESRNDVEISINFETELFIHLSLSWFSCPVLQVDEIELLFNLSIEV